MYVPDLDLRIRYMNSVPSDNSSFWNYGYPAFCGIEDMPLNNPYYHRTTDRVQNIDFTFYADVTRAAVATLAQMAVIDSSTSSVEAGVLAAPPRVSPNPARGQVTIEMAARPSLAGFEVYDVRGRLVSRIAPEVAGGMARAVWNGTDASGGVVGPGIYFLRPTDSKQGTKVVLLR